MLWSARSGSIFSPTLRTPWPASTSLSTPTPTPRSPTCPGWSQRTLWTAWGTSPTSPSRPRWRPWQWWWLESDDSDVFRTEKASSAPGTRTGRWPGSTGPGTEAGRWTTQYASSVWFNKNIMLSVEENSFLLNKLHISLWIAYCQAWVRSPKVQSPKVKTKRTWADTKITWATHPTPPPTHPPTP